MACAYTGKCSLPYCQSGAEKTALPLPPVSVLKVQLRSSTTVYKRQHLWSRGKVPNSTQLKLTEGCSTRGLQDIKGRCCLSWVNYDDNTVADLLSHLPDSSTDDTLTPAWGSSASPACLHWVAVLLAPSPGMAAPSTDIMQEDLHTLTSSPSPHSLINKRALFSASYPGLLSLCPALDGWIHNRAQHIIMAIPWIYCLRLVYCLKYWYLCIWS